MAEPILILPSSSVSLIEFHCFNNLPLEIRQHVWQLCLPGPRIHRIGWTDRQKSSRSSCTSPIIMFVSRESRKEALHHVKILALPSIFHTGTPRTPSGCISRCYFNPAIDTLFVTSPSHPTMSLSPWLRRWVEGMENTDFSIVKHIAIDRAWLEPISLLSGSGLQLGEFVRLLGNVKVVHVVSQNSHWSMRPWAMWREIGCLPENMRAEFTWVDMEEVKKRPVGGYTRIWGEWGDNSQMARAGTDILSLDGEDAKERRKEVERTLNAERDKFPTGWRMPRVQLDFVRYDRVKRIEVTVGKSENPKSELGRFGAILSIFPLVLPFKKWASHG